MSNLDFDEVEMMVLAEQVAELVGQPVDTIVADLKALYYALRGEPTEAGE